MQLFVEGQVKTFSATRAAEVAHKLAELNELRGAQEQQLELRLANVIETVRDWATGATHEGHRERVRRVRPMGQGQP